MLILFTTLDSSDSIAKPQSALTRWGMCLELVNILGTEIPIVQSVMLLSISALFEVQETAPRTKRQGSLNHYHLQRWTHSYSHQV